MELTPCFLPTDTAAPSMAIFLNGILLKIFCQKFFSFFCVGMCVCIYNSNNEIKSGHTFKKGLMVERREKLCNYILIKTKQLRIFCPYCIYIDYLA